MAPSKLAHLRPGWLRQVVWNLALLWAGSVLCAVAINGILVPHQFLSGGLMGLALVLFYLTPVLPLAALYFLLNVPIFALGWLYVGRRFFLYSILGLFVFTGTLEVVQVTLPVQDKILAALLAGILNGIGGGLVLRSRGSAGGSDILSVIFYQRFSIRLGTTILSLNVVVLLLAAFLFSLEGALYTLIYMFVTARIVNLVVTGLSQRKAVFIISPHWEKIAESILLDIRLGVTILEGQGGYSRKQERILYAIIAFQDLPRLKRTILRIDPDAFVVVTDTLEVMGQRMGNEPHW